MKTIDQCKTINGNLLTLIWKVYLIRQRTITIHAGNAHINCDSYKVQNR